MQPMNPQADGNTLIQNQSFFKVLSGNVDMGSAATFDSSGNPLTYNQGNGSGILIRVDATSSSSGAQKWTGANTNTTITHNLGRLPLGYIPVDKGVALDVYAGTIAATSNTITLQTTVDAQCVLYIF